MSSTSYINKSFNITSKEQGNLSPKLLSPLGSKKSTSNDRINLYSKSPEIGSAQIDYANIQNKRRDVLSKYLNSKEIESLHVLPKKPIRNPQNAKAAQHFMKFAKPVGRNKFNIL